MVLFEQYAETNETATKNASSDVFSLVQEEFMEICYDFDENSYKEHCSRIWNIGSENHCIQHLILAYLFKTSSTVTYLTQYIFFASVNGDMVFKLYECRIRPNTISVNVNVSYAWMNSSADYDKRTIYIRSDYKDCRYESKLRIRPTPTTHLCIVYHSHYVTCEWGAAWMSIRFVKKVIDWLSQYS